MILSFQREFYSMVHEELMKLVSEHCLELLPEGGKTEANHNHEMYLETEGAGTLALYTLRDSGKMIGYGLYFITSHHHFKEMTVAHNDVFYLHPSYRGEGVATDFLGKIEDSLTSYKVDTITMTMKIGRSAKMYEDRDYSPYETVYRKELGV